MKNKLFIVMIFSLMLLLAACSENESTAGSSDGTTSESEASEKESEVEESEEAEPLVEISQEVSTAFKSYEGSEYTKIHVAAIYENRGNVPVKINETQMNHKGTDGSILGTSTTIYSVPSIIAPGETAFIVETALIEGIEPDAFEETSYNFSIDETDDDANLMEISGVSGIPTSDSYKVTGLVKNISEEQQDDIRIAAALLDVDGNLLGVLKGSVDIGVAPGGEAGFELSYPDVPPSIVDKVETIDVRSYGWNWAW